jgi:four helix bundle protein
MENQFENLEIWKKTHQLVLKIYKITKTFPSEEKFSLVDQLRRAAVSIVANIVEGNIRQSRKEFLQFVYISKGSLEEVKYYLLLARELGYIDQLRYCQTQDLANECGKLISGFIKYLKSNI